VRPYTNRRPMDLITVTQYKSYRGITGNAEDTRLNIIVPSVSTLVKNYCGRSFLDYAAANKVDVFSMKWPQNVVFLSEIPVISIVSVEELESEESSTYVTLTASQYKVDTFLDAIYRIEAGRRQDYPEGINSVRVTYRGGYTSLPVDLKLAVTDLVTYYLKEEWKPEKNQGTFTIRNEGAEPDFPEHIKRVLDLYRNG
jgi:hypothetical protein